MRIVYLNINKAAAQRQNLLVKYIGQLEADLVGLGEVTRSNAESLFARLAQYGHCHHCFRSPDGARGAVAVVTRQRPDHMRIAYLQKSSAHDGIPRIAEVEMDGLSIAFLYFPNHRNKFPYFKRILRDGRRAIRAARPTAFIGDLNTGDSVDYGGPKSEFTAQAEFDGLKRIGFRDLMLEHNPSGREPTWFSTFGNGFRLDHALATSAFARRVRAARYDHSPRDRKLTDHSAMIIDVD